MEPNKFSSNPPKSITNTFELLPTTVLKTQQNRVQPRQIASGDHRGTTERYVNSDGSYITIGVIPDTDGEFGIAFFNSSGDMVSKSTGLTDYKYDLSTGKNYYQNGKLPDGSYGSIFAKSGYDVVDVIL